MKFEEKRKFPRLKIKRPLRYRIRGTPSFGNAITNDISLGGIGFTNNEFIAPQTAMELELGVLSRTLNPIGRVAWAMPIPHSERYQLGVEFLEVDPREKKYLDDFLNLQTSNL